MKTKNWHYVYSYTHAYRGFFSLLRKIIWDNFPPKVKAGYTDGVKVVCESSGRVVWFFPPSLPSTPDHLFPFPFTTLKWFGSEEKMADSTKGRWTLNTPQSLRATPEAASWDHLPSLKTSPICSGAGCNKRWNHVPSSHQWEPCVWCLFMEMVKGCLHRLQAAYLENSQHSGFCGFLAIWAVFKARAIWNRGVFQTSLHVPCFYHPFCGSKPGLSKS